MLIADENLIFSVSSRIATAGGYVLSGDSNYKELFKGYEEQGKQQEEIVRTLDTSEVFDESIAIQLEEWNDYIVSEVFEVYDDGHEELAQENLLKSDST